MPLVVEVRRVRSPNEPDLSSRRVEIFPGLRVRDRGFIVAHLSVLVTSCQDRGFTHGPVRRLEGNQGTPQGRGVAVDFHAASHREVHMSSAMRICHWRGGTHGHVHPRAACGPDPLSQDNSTVRCGSTSAWAAASAAQDFSVSTAPSTPLSGRLLQRRCYCSSGDAIVHPSAG